MQAEAERSQLAEELQAEQERLQGEVQQVGWGCWGSGWSAGLGQPQPATARCLCCQLAALSPQDLNRGWNLLHPLQLQASLEAATAAAAEASAALDAEREAAAAAAAAAEEARGAAVATAEEAHAAAAAAAEEARATLAAELEAAQAQLASEGQRLQAELDEAQNVALQLVAEKEQLEVRGRCYAHNAVALHIMLLGEGAAWCMPS